MAFSFGTSGQSAFGTTQQKPTGFGAPFGTPATTASTGFGAFGSTFGSTTQQPAFGSSTFGAPASGTGAAGAAPAFGTGFGATASAAPTFGSTFGAPASSAAPSFGAPFGTSSTGTGLFGGTAAGAAKPPGLFGTATTSTPSLFSTPAGSQPGLFGTTTTQAPSLFGTTTTATAAAPSLFGGVGMATSSAPSLFGTSFGAATTSAPSLFGTTTTTSNTGFNLFGTTTTSAPSLFGSSFGTATTQSGFTGFGGGTTGFGVGGGGFGGFGAATGTAPCLTGGAFGTASAVAAQAQQQIDPNQIILASVYAINVFNDERDDILKKWNMLQASWGTGKGFYSANQPPIEYTPKNPFYRFKGVGYNLIPELDNSEGYVTLIFNRKDSELSNQRNVLITGLGGILGNKPNLTVTVESLKGLSDNQTELRITVTEKGVTGSTKKIPASDLCNFLNQPAQKQQLTNVGVVSIAPYVTPSRAFLEEYKKKPPPGIDAQMWHAANADNPNPQRYVPAPFYGFADLKGRMLSQQHETSLHTSFIMRVANDVSELKKKHLSSIAQITELKQKFLQLQHRILRILVKQESTRKVGVAITPEEELLRGRLEMLHAHLKVPTQFKGQINELLSRVKMMGNVERQCYERYNIDPDAQEDIKQFLKMEQNGIAHLVNIINNDMKTLKIMSEGMNQILQSRNTVS